MSEVIRRRIDRGRITAEAVFIPTRFQAERRTGHFQNIDVGVLIHAPNNDDGVNIPPSLQSSSLLRASIQAEIIA
jgi:hypothetical protein